MDDVDDVLEPDVEDALLDEPDDDELPLDEPEDDELDELVPPLEAPEDDVELDELVLPLPEDVEPDAVAPLDDDAPPSFASSGRSNPLLPPGSGIVAELSAAVQVRHRGASIRADIRIHAGSPGRDGHPTERATVRLAEPTVAAPGQAAVLYDGEVCLGGGIIAGRGD